MVAVGYKSAISTCMGIDVVEIISISEVSPSSWKPLNSGPVARFIHTFSKLCQKNMKDTDTYSKLQCIRKERGALSTNNSKNTQVKETMASNEGGIVRVASTQKDVVESTSIVGTMLAINLRKTTK